MKALYANVEAVKKLQVLQDGTASKTDRKDARTILAVAKVGKLSKKGRPLLRKLLTQTCLPLVRRGELFGEEYHARKKAGEPGKRAMTAIANKYLNMIFGLHKSRQAFDRERVFRPLSSPLDRAA